MGSCDLFRANDVVDVGQFRVYVALQVFGWFADPVLVRIFSYIPFPISFRIVTSPLIPCAKNVLLLG